VVLGVSARRALGRLLTNGFGTINPALYRNLRTEVRYGFNFIVAAKQEIGGFWCRNCTHWHVICILAISNAQKLNKFAFLLPIFSTCISCSFFDKIPKITRCKSAMKGKKTNSCTYKTEKIGILGVFHSILSYT
jgi:hypothetical protein